MGCFGLRYLDYFRLKEPFHGVESPFRCDFIDGLNVIVGENGSGKSTMLWLMSNLDGMDKVAEVKLVNKDLLVDFSFLDTEKQNPRMTDNSHLRGEDYTYGLLSNFSSHGEVIFPLVKAIGEMKNKICIVDEPESGVSLSNQKKLVRAFRKAVKNGCQLVLTTHSYVIIKSVPEVYDLSVKKWVNSKDYLKGLKL